MKIYIVQWWKQYYGTGIDSVYATFESASKRKDELDATGDHDGNDILSFEVKE